MIDAQQFYYQDKQQSDGKILIMKPVYEIDV